MNVIRFTDGNFTEQVRGLARASSLFDSAIEEQVRAIVEAVRARGDAALLESPNDSTGPGSRRNTWP